MPKKKLVLFVPGSGPDQVFLNWYGLASDKLSFYAEAFHLAGRTLAAKYGTTGATRDFEALPVVFLYRHSLELYLKSIVIPGDILLRLRGEVTIDLHHIGNHFLAPLFQDFERIANVLGWNKEMTVDDVPSREHFKAVLAEVDRFDRLSMSFRYPTDKDGNPSLPNNFSFSITDFASKMDALLEFLEGAEMGVTAALEGLQESLGELREYQQQQQAEYESWFRDEYQDEW